ATPPPGFGPNAYDTAALRDPGPAAHQPTPPPVTYGGQGATTATQAPPKKKRRVLPIAIAVALVLGIGGAGGAYFALKDKDKDKGTESTDQKNTQPPQDDQSEEPSAGDSPSAEEGDDVGQAVPNPTPVEYNGINLTADYHLYFADEPVEPSDSEDGNNDLEYNNSFGTKTFDTNTGNKLVLLNNAQEGSLETCRSETRFTQSIDFARITKGSKFCVRTASGHIGLVTYNGPAPKSDPSDYVKLDLTVWRNALDVEEPTS
ncbi:serine/threonine protein kinase, partial [Streptomyces sp. T-3]|nr:serine/threonine protein kinase [Streptomyces sp. T-3]